MVHPRQQVVFAVERDVKSLSHARRREVRDRALSPHELPSAPRPRASTAAPQQEIRDAGAAARREDDGLARERAILEVARTALGRGDAASALDALNRHASEHPSGKLTEERDAMTIQALVAAGRLDEAKSKARVFAARYPNSFFLPSIEASVDSLH